MESFSPVHVSDQTTRQRYQGRTWQIAMQSMRFDIFSIYRNPCVEEVWGPRLTKKTWWDWHHFEGGKGHEATKKVTEEVSQLFAISIFSSMWNVHQAAIGVTENYTEGLSPRVMCTARVTFFHINWCTCLTFMTSCSSFNLDWNLSALK